MSEAAARITDTAAADALIDADRPSWLFKHSIACPISARAHAAFTDYLAEADHAHEPAGIVVIQQARAVSDHIAARTGVAHQSPQVLLVRDGDVLFHTSHMKITRDALAQAMADAHKS